MIGQTLSHYKIISKLGQGGQGEVYLAEDSRLDRKVALKILPQHLSERADLRERFEREARAVSSLNHPHICTLYDIGEQDGIHYLVMEHLEGETLAARLEKGALPLEQTLQYAIQIADALDKAHRQGVVHRDLKPGNIMLVKSGAKLLDFGLAKLQATETPTNLSARPPSKPVSPPRGLSWARCSTWPQSSWKAKKRITGPTYSPLVLWCMRWRRVRRRLRGRARPVCWSSDLCTPDFAVVAWSLTVTNHYDSCFGDVAEG